LTPIVDPVSLRDKPKTKGMSKRNMPKKKKDQLALALPMLGYCDRPDPDDPGGLGAEESGTERTGPTQYLLVPIHGGRRLAEKGRHYDSANDPVTVAMLIYLANQLIRRADFTADLANSLLRRLPVGAIMTSLA
jgi:hypothetical protein